MNTHNGRQELLARGATIQWNHLIQSGKPNLGTLCGLTLFDSNRGLPSFRPADIPGWSRGGGVSGPQVEQRRCTECWARAERGFLPESIEVVMPSPYPTKGISVRKAIMSAGETTFTEKDIEDICKTLGIDPKADIEDIRRINDGRRL